MTGAIAVAVILVPVDVDLAIPGADADVPTLLHDLAGVEVVSIPSSEAAIEQSEEEGHYLTKTESLIDPGILQLVS